MNTTIKIVLGTVVGFGAGYFLAKLRLEQEFQRLLTSESESIRHFYRGYYSEKAQEEQSVVSDDDAVRSSERDVQSPDRQDDPEPVTPVPGHLIDYAARSMVNYSGAVNEVGKPAERPSRDVAANPASVWDSEEDRPYVISADEFSTSDNGFSQVSVIWYRGDDTLADERLQKVEHVDEFVGLYNLQKFGEMSEDPNLVFVRNPRLRKEIEITLNTGAYSEEVLGEDPSSMM